MTTSKNPRQEAAFASLQAAFAEHRRVARPQEAVPAEPGSRRLILSLARA